MFPRSTTDVSRRKPLMGTLGHPRLLQPSRMSFFPEADEIVTIGITIDED